MKAKNLKTKPRKLQSELDREDTFSAAQGFDAALTSIRLGFAESGESEEDLTALLEASLRATRFARHRNDSA